MLRVLIIGDVVGRPGRNILRDKLAQLQKAEKIDFTIVNAENASGGNGLNFQCKEELLRYGADVLTMGNHTWNNREILSYIDDEPRLVRPANFPGDCPGQGWHVYTVGINERLAVINLCGRVFMSPLDCPFQTVDAILQELAGAADYIVVDMHAEATSEKIALAHYLDGRVSALVGTHTHVPTADETILPGGTAYITDLGMTGPVDSVLGVKKEQVIQRFLTVRPVRFEVAAGAAALNGAVVELSTNGRAVSIHRIQVHMPE